MEILYRLGEASAPEVARHMVPDPGGDSVRVTLGILKKKGHVQSRADGRRNIYRPVVPRATASRSAVRNVVRTFFGGSSSSAILAMLGMSRLSPDELDEIAEWVDKERGANESSDG